jgi:3-methylfumaryl-CoA hydratase
MSEWQAWVDRKQSQTDRVDQGLAARWLATLDRAAPADGAMPQAFHWCLCLPDAATARLGPDGHPLRDDGPESFLPPVPLPRRMWASSKIEFHAPLRPGDGVARHSRVASVTEKQGGSGRLVFVEVEHDTLTGETLAVREAQSIVYRDAATPGATPVPPPPGGGKFDPSGWDAHRAITPGEALLFRYSALTFNSHRIHYDAPYARGEERYRGLVVQGPLTATLLLDLARRQFGDNVLTRFAFRGISPAIAGEALHLVLRGTGEAIELGAFAGDGRHVMSAQAAL